MATICSKCGEQLLGSVNRCWKCGTEYQAEPESDIPPICRGPVLREYLSLGNELTAEELPVVIVAEEVEQNDIPQDSVLVEETPSESDTQELAEPSATDTSIENEVSDSAISPITQPFAIEPEDTQSGLGNTYLWIIGLSIVAGTSSIFTVYAIPLSLIALGFAIWKLNDHQGSLTWVCLLLAILAFAISSIRLAIFIYSLVGGPFSVFPLYW
ncbi:MAG: hypothetical protein COA78_09645 [Blastopirellula sp.]|nr:MAG: hypothetical protein COA78_09645 [Blastopirellula sp.]